MYPSSLLLLLASSVLAARPALAEAADSQKPLGASLPGAEKPPPPAGTAVTASTAPLRHAARLNYSSPAPHLFASTYGLLQQWSNTVFPNGHTMAAVEVPAFTLFYHGRMDEEGPPSPEWLAFDIEMAYGIMGSTRQSFMLTYQTTRPVKALYFDGESATLMGLGQLDTQMLHLYGNVSGPGDGDGRWHGLQPEYDRAMGLCDWLLERGLRGDGWGIEGVVRMNAGFEMIWCSFGGDSLRLVSKTNVTAPQTKKRKKGSGGGRSDDGAGEARREKKSERDGGEAAPTSAYPLPPQPTLTDRPVIPSRPPVPPNWRGIMGPVDREPFLQSQGWGWFSAATWHYGSNGDGAGSGETRARVLGCGVASWYSKGAWGSVVAEERERLNLTGEGYWVGGGDGGDRAAALKELGRRRRLHHLEGATAAQAADMRRETEAMLREAVAGGGAGCSGMNWVGTMGEVVQRTAGHLKGLEQGARGPGGGDWGNETAVEEWLYGLRGQSHGFLVSFLEYPRSRDAGTWEASGALFGETYSRCRYRYTRLLVGAALSARERELRDAAEEVMGAVCGVLLEVGFGIEGAWYDLEEGRGSGSGSGSGLEARAAGWADAVRRLRAWVGWEGEFIRCGRVCGWDERCYIPMWPMLRSIWGGGGGKRPRPPPEYGPDGGRGPEHGGGNHTGRPGGGIPGRGAWWMGNETDLWEPKCVKMEDMMPRVRGD
ncbi:hypothetical protein LX36DRAFT_615254 [Colletotrichum falcatum]|nr:hypothetical protein LX36DRAFT_615254 [Colletotrichum falcatum]